MQARYGIDAPGLVRGFLAAGLALLAMGALAATFGAPLWPPAAWLAPVLGIAALYPLGMFALMLWESLAVKVRGREAILDLVTWRGDEAVLDVGCGRGLMLVGAARRLTTGRAVGVDLWLARDQSSNAKAAPLDNARIEGVADKVDVETADMRALPFAGNSFDVVVSNWAVHNLEAEADRARALSEMVRVLHPGGTILLTDIACRDEYLAKLKALGAGDVRLVVASPLKDRFLAAVSFGSYRPATIVARAFAPAPHSG